MTVPAREVKVGWRVNPGTPHEWVVGAQTDGAGFVHLQAPLANDGHSVARYLRLDPDDPVDAAPPPRMITVPAMNDEMLAWIKSMGGQTPHHGWDKWIAEVVAAHEREST